MGDDGQLRSAGPDQDVEPPSTRLGHGEQPFVLSQDGVGRALCWSRHRTQLRAGPRSRFLTLTSKKVMPGSSSGGATVKGLRRRVPSVRSRRGLVRSACSSSPFSPSRKRACRRVARWRCRWSSHPRRRRGRIVDLIAEGENVVAQFKCSGTHRGEWLGVPATGRRFENVDEIYIFGVQDGKLVSALGVEDNLSRLRQLGITPQPRWEAKSPPRQLRALLRPLCSGDKDRVDSRPRRRRPVGRDREHGAGGVGV